MYTCTFDGFLHCLRPTLGSQRARERIGKMRNKRAEKGKTIEYILHTVGVHSTRRRRERFHFEWHRVRMILLLAFFLRYTSPMAWHSDALHVSFEQLKLISLPLTMGASLLTHVPTAACEHVRGITRNIVATVRPISFDDCVVVGDNRNKCH